MKSIRFIALGCRLNQAEEAVFAGDFAGGGWSVDFDGAARCDVVLVHSCAVTRQAERTTLQALRALKRDVPQDELPIVAVAGCATAALSEEVLRAAGADIVIPRHDNARIREIVERFVAEGVPPRPLEDAPRGVFGNPVVPPLPQRAASAADSETAGAFGGAKPLFRHGRDRAFLKVQDGCDFRCAYCIVPFTRGRSVSRPFGEAVAAAAEFARGEFREIVLTGCNLACYAADGRTLPDLVSAAADAISGSPVTLSLGSVEPGICDDGIIDAMLRHCNVRRFIHLPIQSGDDTVLRLAGRRYDGRRIREILSAYCDRLGGLELSADFIAGLPGEDERAFEATCALVRDFPFASIHVFPYSRRQGTAALDMGATPSRAVAKERAAILRSLVKTQHSKNTI